MTPITLPITVFDLHLTESDTPAAQILREDAANRAVQFLKQLAEVGLLRGPDGAAIPAAGVHYRGVTRDLAVDYPSLKATRAAGLLVDDDALEAQLLAGAGAADGGDVGDPPAEEPAAEEPPADAPLEEAPAAEETP